MSFILDSFPYPLLLSQLWTTQKCWRVAFKTTMKMAAEPWKKVGTWHQARICDLSISEDDFRRMIFTLKEVIKWLGLSIFELWLHIVAIFVFSVLVAVKLEGGTLSWWTVFVPLFACDGCVAYFTAIVFIRLFLIGDRRLAGKRTAWSLLLLTLLLSYKILLCHRLENYIVRDYAVIHVPLFLLLLVLAVRACQVDC